MELDIYTRVSRLSDKRMLSTDGQEADCRDRVREVGATVGQVHTDPGKSAWNPKVKRPGWDELMARIEAGETDGVVVFDLTRFTRRPMEGERLIEAANRGLTVLDSERDFDLTSPDGKASFRDHMKMAAYQSDRSSTTTARGKRRRAQGGQPNGSSRPFGFEKDGITVRETEAEIIREMGERFLAGESQDAIRADLDSRGITTSYGKLWSRGGFRHVLMRSRNAGWIVSRGEPVSRLPGEPILDQLIYDRVVAKFKSKRGRPVSARYVCSGIAVCGNCGHSLTGKPRKNMKPYPDGEVRRQYWCAPNAGGCGLVTIDQRALDDWAGTFSMRTLADPEHYENQARLAREATASRRELLAEQSSLITTMTEVAERVGRQEPGCTLAWHDAIVKPHQARLGEITTELARLEAGNSPPELYLLPGQRTISAESSDRIGWLIEWDEGTSAARRRILQHALNGRKLVITPGKSSQFDPARVSVM